MEKKNKMGRPTKYSKGLVDTICKRLAKGESLLRICRDEEMPSRETVYQWLFDEEKEYFSDNYTKARNAQADVLFDELLDIADDGTNDYMERESRDGSVFNTVDHEHIARSRLRVDTRKWYLSKVLPKKYGEKLDVDHTSKGKQIVGFNYILPEDGRNQADDSANHKAA